MVLKKIDKRIKICIENGVEQGHRSIFLIVGDRARDQIPVLYNMLIKARIKARPSVLWCYKNELNFENNKKKRFTKLKKRIEQGVNVQTDNIFDTFVESSQIRFTYYKDAVKILGNTFGMLVLQDFEALTPNTIARSVETVEGGGIIAFLLSSIDNIRQLFSLSMDVHARYRTESHQDVMHRFNERFILSLRDCDNSLIVDDKLNVLPIFSNNFKIESVPKRSIADSTPEQTELKNVVSSLSDVQPLGTLARSCKTLDQAKSLCAIFEKISASSSNNVISLTSARGRGKSALLGMLVAGSISIGFSNIYVVAPCLENLITFFEFLIKGLVSLGFAEKVDFELERVCNNNMKMISKLKFNRNHRQIVQYVDPSSVQTIQMADLVVCDECAAIPLPIVRKLLGPHHLVLSSTINGYEGTGRSLSLKLIKEIREKSINSLNSSSLTEITLESSIRYNPNDPVEKWLNMMLCLDNINVPTFDKTLLTSSSDCQLFYVSRDTLFSYHNLSEKFLQLITSIFVSSHYKNSPNDLQLMADAPAHHIFVLVPNPSIPKTGIPQILCVLQVCLEGGISRETVNRYEHRGQRASGDLIPWSISQQFCEPDFAALSGARIIRISTHPDYTGMGYGSKAIELLIEHFSHANSLCNVEHSSKETVKSNESLQENDILQPRTQLPPLLINLKHRVAEKINYIGVSYGLTSRLLKFWKRLHFVPLYLRQTPNQLTGEFTTIMVRPVDMDFEKNKWIVDYFHDFRSRFMSLLAYNFRDLAPSVALSLMYHNDISLIHRDISEPEIDYLVTPHDLKRLESYSNNLVDYHFVMDLVPTLSRFLLNDRFGSEGDDHSWFQLSVILALGLQLKTVELVEKDLNIPAVQIMATFNKVIRRIFEKIRRIKKEAISKDLSHQNSTLSDENADKHSSMKSSADKTVFYDCNSDIKDSLKHSDNQSALSVAGPLKRTRK